MSLPCCNRQRRNLLETVARPDWPEREGAWSALQSLTKLRWPWAPLLAARIARPEQAERWLFAKLPEWDEAAERPQPAQVSLNEADVLACLAALTGQAAEQRPGQRAYAAEAAHLFAPRRREGSPHVLLAQAGTGIGKTLGYLAPSALWAGQSGGTVWVSTFTKALQRQLRQESGKAWAARREDGSRPVVVRKGRENYLCLLNLEDALQGGFGGRAAVFAQLVARWAAFSQDGDMVGGDLPGWLTTLFRQRGVAALDRPARRMRLCRLPALPQMLHRTQRPGQRPGRSGDRQSRPGHGQCGKGTRPRRAPDAAGLRRRPPRLRGRGLNLRRRADRAGEHRTAPLGDRPGERARKGGGAGFPRGSPMSPAMTRSAARPSPPRAMPPRRCQAMAGSSASPRTSLSARLRRCSPLSAQPFTPATRAADRRQAMGWKPKRPSSMARSSKWQARRRRHWPNCAAR